MSKKAQSFTPEIVAVDSLKEHPKNYQKHPDDQLEHLMKSLALHGFYRNVVVARDTILAGHGIVQAAKKKGLKEIPIVRLNIDPNSARAMSILAGDNEVSNLADVDDRALSEILKELKEADMLLGTGYNEQTLATLLMVTRPESEIKDLNEAAEYLGMPKYPKNVEKNPHVIVWFGAETDRESFAKLLNVELTPKTKYIYWPPRARDKIAHLKYEPAQSSSKKADKAKKQKRASAATKS